MMATVKSEQNDKNHVTILMATFNGYPWLSWQLSSLLAQTHINWSLWVSDDGSSDETLRLLEDFGVANPGRLARIIDGPRNGAAANFLHLLCHPDLPAGPVAFCDQDDVWMPDKLTHAVEVLSTSGDKPAVWAARYLVSDEALAYSTPSAIWTRPPSFANAMVQNILSGHTLTLNALALAVLRKVGVTNVPHHDWWVYLVMTAIGAKVHVDDRIVLYYRQHDRNVMGARNLMRLARFRDTLDGTLQTWIASHIEALIHSDLPLAQDPMNLISAWQDLGKSRLEVVREFGVHRQSILETKFLHLVAALGKL